MRRLCGVVLTFLLALTGMTIVAGAPAQAAATCTSGVAVYGVLPDGRLTYTVVDPDNGNVIHGVLVSSKTLGFTAKAMATLNSNTILITSTGGTLYRVDVTTFKTSLTFDGPFNIDGGWTHNLLTYDGYGHLYGTTSGGTLLQYVVSRPKPTGPEHIGQRREIGNGGFALKTLAAAGDDRLIATASDGQLISYAVNASGGYTRSQLDDAGWQSFQNLVSPGGGLYYGKNSDGAMYWYEDDDPADGSGADISYHLSDPVSSRGWTQYLLSANPGTCTATPTKPLRAKIGAIATGEIGEGELTCDKYHPKCDRGDNDWCAMFATWVWYTAGVQGVPRGTLIARALGSWGVDHNLFKPRSGSTKGSPKVGDWVIYGPPDGKSGGHVDVITAVRPDGTLTVVGGNVNDQVKRRTIDPDTARNGAGRYLISGYVSPPGA